MKIVTVSTDLRSGGAGIAAYRMHMALKDSIYLEAKFLTSDKANIDNENILSESLIQRHVRRVACKSGKLLSMPFMSCSKNDIVSWSALSLPFNNDRRLLELVGQGYTPHIHWFNHEFISLNVIQRIARTQRVFWTMHDLWPILGLRHYEHDSIPLSYSEALITNQLVKLKKTLFQSCHIRIIAPSTWLGDKVREFIGATSASTVSVVPNPVPDCFFSQELKERCRYELGLPLNKILLLFCAASSINEPRKGFSYLLESLHYLKQVRSDIHLVTIGGRYCGPPVHMEGRSDYGKVSDECVMAKFYRACDIVVVPSIQDNLPQVATEAQAAGRPVVSFQIGGLTDIIIDGITGTHAPELTPLSLSSSIDYTVRSNMLGSIGQGRITERARSLWSMRVIRDRMLDLYNE